jgi:Ca2+-binding RTX toxin-like protein
VLSYSTTADGIPDNLLVRLSSNAKAVQILHNGTVVRSASLKSVNAVQITGSSDNDQLTLDYSAGFFSFPVNFTADGGTDKVVAARDANFTLTDGTLVVAQVGVLTFTGVEAAELTGGPSVNLIDASDFSGSTVLRGLGGNDTILGGRGNDEIHGGDGDDLLISVTHGNDVIFSGAGNDWLRLDTGSTITGNNSGGDDTIDMSPSDQGVVATVTNAGATVDGGDGTFTGTGTYVQIIGSGYDDCFYDEGDGDYIFDGGMGDDCYYLDPSNPTTDVVRDPGGDDSLIFAGSTDPVTGEPDPVTVDLNVTDGGVGAVDESGNKVLFFGVFENVTGSAGDDTIIGNEFDNVLDGGPGDDTIDGRGGTNTIKTVPGSTDTFIGTSGLDILDFSGAEFAISLNLGLPSGNRQTVDTAGNGVILIGSFEVVIGSRFDDVLSGDNAANVLIGGGGNDRLQGQGGNDVLVGGDGDDDLNGGDGRDVLIGGRGADRLKGSSDEDLLVAGYTAYDEDVPALLAIQAEWTAPDVDYLTRVRHLRGELPGGANGSVYLNVAPTALSPQPTVFDDLAADTLTGAQQLDWFIIDVGDTITDQVQSEEVVDVTAPGP